MFLKLLLISTVLVALALIGLSITMLVKRGGKFPDTSVGKNKEMRARGITCVKHDELRCYREMKNDLSCTCGTITSHS